MRDKLERIWREFGCRDALRFLRWKDQDGTPINNTIHYKPKTIKVKGSLANRPLPKSLPRYR